jgi:aspartokinase
MGKKFDCNIIAKSTFSDKGGTKICQQIESSEVKSIIKNEKLVTIEIEKQETIKKEEIYYIYQKLLEDNIIVESFKHEENNLQFRILKTELNKVQELLENKFPEYEMKQKDVVKLCIVGYGITQDNQVLSQVMEVLKKYNIEIIDISLTQAKIEILVDNIEDAVVEKLHEKLIKN